MSNLSFITHHIERLPSNSKMRVVRILRSSPVCGGLSEAICQWANKRRGHFFDQPSKTSISLKWRFSMEERIIWLLNRWVRALMAELFLKLCPHCTSYQCLPLSVFMKYLVLFRENCKDFVYHSRRNCGLESQTAYIFYEVESFRLPRSLRLYEA